MRRWCRESPLKSVLTKARTKAVASWVVCMRAPMDITLALLCCRASSAVWAPDQRGPDAGHLVGRDLLAVADADHDSQAALVRDDGSAVRRQCGG